MPDMALTSLLQGTCVGGTGPDLTGYPSLTYAPLQHGEGVRLARNGLDIDAVVEAASSIMAEVDALACREGITLAELCDVLRYARANEMI